MKENNWKEELQLLRSIVAKVHLEETIKWNAPVFMAEGRNILSFAAFKNHFGIWFFQGGLLKDPYGVLTNAQEGKTKAMRQWKMTSINDIKEDILLEYIAESVANEKKGIAITPVKNTSFEMPELLHSQLQADAKLKQAFDQLAPYKQKEFALYISEAKREQTKAERLQKILPLILEGKGLNDKYKNC